MKDESADKPQCLEGYTFVVSGIFNEVSRDKVEQLIAEYGGRCTSAISGKTDYLITGYKLEDGREVTEGGKYKNANKKGTKILDEAGFEQLMRDKLKDPEYTLAAKMPALPEGPKKEVSAEDPDKTKNDMWTDKYAPKGFQDLVGNNGTIAQLYEWLKDWDDVCIRGNKKIIPVRRGMAWGETCNPNARAALLSGPPGIGKTSAARIVCA